MGSDARVAVARSYVNAEPANAEYKIGPFFLPESSTPGVLGASLGVRPEDIPVYSRIVCCNTSLELAANAVKELRNSPFAPGPGAGNVAPPMASKPSITLQFAPAKFQTPSRQTQNIATEQTLGGLVSKSSGQPSSFATPPRKVAPSGTAASRIAPEEVSTLLFGKPAGPAQQAAILDAPPSIPAQAVTSLRATATAPSSGATSTGVSGGFLFQAE